MGPRPTHSRSHTQEGTLIPGAEQFIIKLHSSVSQCDDADDNDDDAEGNADDNDDDGDDEGTGDDLDDNANECGVGVGGNDVD